MGTAGSGHFCLLLRLQNHRALVVNLASNTDQSTIAYREQKLLHANHRLTELTQQIAGFRDLPRSNLWVSDTVCIEEPADMDEQSDTPKGEIGVCAKQTLIITNFAPNSAGVSNNCNTFSALSSTILGSMTRLAS